MSEDHSEDVSGSTMTTSSPGQATASPSQPGGSPEPDYTPLKKRRLATYNESTEDKSKAPESVKTDIFLREIFKVYNSKIQF